MNIGIDANCIVFDRSGFGRFSYNLVKNLLLLDKKNQYFLYASFIRKPTRRQILDNLILEANAQNAQVKIIPIPARWKEFIMGTPYSLKHLIKDELDLYYAPHYAGIPKNGFETSVVTIQDLVFMRFPEHRGRRLSNYYLKRTKLALENSKMIIAASSSTKKDLIELLDVDKDLIEVVHLGVGPEFKVNDPRKTAEVVKKYIPGKTKYILSVSTIEPRKNLPLLIKAFSLLPNQMKREYKIVLTGGSGWNNQELTKTIKNYNLTDKVIFTGFVSNEDLPYIYNGASLFVFPSLYEGFGLPPLEAMACGCPVVCSSASSLPEVVGKAAIQIDPSREEKLARAIEKVLTSPRVAAVLSKKGLLQAKKFSWTKTAQRTLDLFNQFQPSKNAQKTHRKKTKPQDR